MRLGLCDGSDPVGPVLVIGTGRSGTHLLAHAVASHPQVVATIEAPPMFEWATRMALDPGLRAELLPCLVAEYERRRVTAAPRLYLDKSHPNIWMAEELARALPGALFLGTRRDPFATVASMLRHPGVLAWHARWRELVLPNPFLGITAEMQDDYEALPLAAKCALRWRSHEERMTHLQAILGARLLVVRYEDLVTDTDSRLRELAAFLGLSSPIDFTGVERGSLDGWKHQLTHEQIDQIAERVGWYPDPA